MPTRPAPSGGGAFSYDGGQHYVGTGERGGSDHLSPGASDREAPVLHGDPAAGLIVHRHQCALCEARDQWLYLCEAPSCNLLVCSRCIGDVPGRPGVQRCVRCLRGGKGGGRRPTQRPSSHGLPSSSRGCGPTAGCRGRSPAAAADTYVFGVPRHEWMTAVPSVAAASALTAAAVNDHEPVEVNEQRKAEGEKVLT
jgi:hypothetical protein